MTRISALLAQPAARAFALLVVVIAVAAAFAPITLTSYGVTFDRVTDQCLVAVGLTLLIILGEIDLSVGSTMAVAGTVAVRASENLLVGTLAAIAVGILIGLINAALVLRAGVNSFIATLGTMTTLAGLALLLTKNNPIPLRDPNAPVTFTDNVVGQLTLPTLIVAGISVLCWIFLARTRIGREFFASGGNVEAAAAADVKVARRKTLGFVLCSVLAAVAGLLDTIKQASASATLGQSVLLIAIAAAVLGGGVLSGGRGSVPGAVMGAVALGAISVALELQGIDASLENVLIGAILFVAVVANRESVDGLRLDILARRVRRT